MNKTKKCIACRKYKTPDNYYIQNGKLHSYCKKCKSEKRRSQLTKEEIKKRNKSYTSRYPDKKRDIQYRYHYGITVKQYNQILVNQKFSCKICRVPQIECIRRFAVDHIANTKIVRGLLCHKCNLALGLFNDDPKLFDIAKTYILEFVPSKSQ